MWGHWLSVAWMRPSTLNRATLRPSLILTARDSPGGTSAREPTRIQPLPALMIPFPFFCVHSPVCFV